MKVPWQRDRLSAFYPLFGCLAALTVLAGFSTTYFFPLAAGRFEGAWILHLHGALFCAWIALLIAQPVLIRKGRLPLHRTLGWAAIPLALAMAASGVGVGLYATARDLAAGMAGLAHSSLVGVATSMAIFLLFFGAAVALRRRPAWHKRMIVLATIAILWPAWFRFRHFLPWVPDPEIWLAIVLADSLILVVMVRDWLRFRAIHPAYGIFGTLLIAEHAVEALLFGSPAWREAGRLLYALFA